MTVQPTNDRDTTPPRRSEAAANRLRAVTDSQARAARERAAAARRRAARTAHRAHRTWIALLFFPAFAVYIVLDAARDLRDYLARARSIELERRPVFRRPASMSPLDERTMDEIVGAVDAIPYDPIPLPSTMSFFRDNGPDALGALLSNNPQITTIPHLYPQPFQERLFTGAEGVQLAGMQAMHEHRGPAVVICHGLLMTKNFDIIIQLARRAFESWGFHVVTLDLRGWGQSAWTTDAPASGGYMEGRDILEVCRELHRDDLVTSVAAIGFSLGGASVLNAAHASSSDPDAPLDGGAVCISAPTNIADALRHISTAPHWRDPFFGLWHLFRATIKGTVRKRGLRRDLRTWVELVDEISVPYYGVGKDEFAERASAVGFANEITVPVLALHADDDFLVPIHHALELADAAVDNPWIHVVTKPYGAHVSFTAVDARWYHTSLRRWLEYWATPGAVDEREDLDAPLAEEYEIGG